jgi:hypothetical protein
VTHKIIERGGVPLPLVSKERWLSHYRGCWGGRVARVEHVGGCCLFAWGGKLNNNKKATTKICCGLRRPQIDIFHSTTNQIHAVTMEEM